jgi:cytochrome P450
MTTTVAPAIDLLDPAAFRGSQPHEQFRWLRDHDPVHWHPEPDGRGFWAITCYEDVRAVGRDPRTFSSYEGGIMVPDLEEVALAGARLMMLVMDPPEHTRCDTRIAGTDIAAGDKVVMYYAAANRDPRAFDDPETLDVRRKPNEHIAFGGGGLISVSVPRSLASRSEPSYERS